MGNMREISIEECNAVFGGTITVNGNPPVVPKTSGWIDPQLLSSLMGGSYGGYLRTQALILATQAAPDVALDEGHVDEGDDDGDGILNRDEEIVVTAEKLNLPGGYFAYLTNGQFIIMKDRCSGDLIVDIAARQAEQLIKSQPDWNEREYAIAIYITGNGDIKLGPTSRGETVAEAQARAIANGETSYAPRTSIALPGEFGGWAKDDPARPLILAIIHNHPDIGYDDDEDFINRYPSDYADGGDYFNMAKLVQTDSRFSNTAAFAQYIVGPDGVLREFNAKDGKITAANDSDPDSRSNLAKDRPCS